MTKYKTEYSNRSRSVKFFLVVTYIYQTKKILPIELKIDVRPNSSESIAFSPASTVRSNFGSIYINDNKRFEDGKVRPELYEKVRKEIIEKLKKLKDPKTGEHVIKKFGKKRNCTLETSWIQLQIYFLCYPKNIR